MNGIDGYRIVEPLGRNDKAFIYRAERGSDGGRVIVKVPAHDHGSHDETERYRHEYAVLRELDDSAHICPAIAVESHHGRPALVLADRGGVVLESMLGQPMALGSFLRTAIYLAEALADIHARGIVHKNIQPSGVLVDDALQRAYFIDFALASALPVEPSEIKPPRLIEGALPYISPEQTGRMNRGIDYRTDLYSLGVTLFRMLTGQLPFRGGDALEWCHAHMAKSPPPPHQLRADVPEPISAIVMALVAKVPEERYQSATGLRRDLQRCLDAWSHTGAVPRFELARRESSVTFHIPARLYGRQRELDILFSSYREVVDGGASKLVLVSGYSGIGKSALVHELHMPVFAARGELAGGKCEQYKRAVPYHALAQAFQELCQRILGEEPHVIGRWRERLLDAVGNNGRVLTDLLPELAAIIGPQEPVPELGPTESQNRFNLVFRRFLRVMARAERPLVLFLDDVQWADSATLQLLHTVLIDPAIRHLLLILAYRDNEVPAAHPLMLVLDSLRKHDVSRCHVHLSPLDLDSLRALVADTLDADPGQDEIRRLAALVHAKTSGNPFYVIQFLTSLHRDGALSRDSGGQDPSGRLVCDMARVENMAHTENVIDYMIRRLRKLDRATREALQIAACCGNQFTFSDVCLAGDVAPAAMRDALRPAIRGELLVPLDDRYRLLASVDGDIESLPAVSYRFQHDRIQQAAYSMLSEDDRRAAHLRIGRRWRDAADHHTLEERIFDIVDQLNHSIELFDDDRERLQLAELDLRAGRKAKAATAYDTAAALLTAAASLLPETAWNDHYELIYAVHRELAECEYLIGRFEASERRFIALAGRARSTADKTELYVLRSRLYQLSGHNARCLDIAREALALFGIEVPQDPEVLAAEIEAGFAENNRELDRRGVASLIDAPVIEDHKLHAIIDLAVVAIPSAYLCAPQYFAWYTNLCLGTALRHGNTPSTCYAYSAYAFFLVSMFNRPRLAWQLSNMALELNERFDNKALRGILLHTHGDHMNYFGQPLASNFPYLERGFIACQEVGDLVYAGFIAFQIVWWFIERGDPLHTVIAQAQRYASFARETSNSAVLLTIELELRFVACLQGKSRALSTLDGAGFDVAAFEAAQSEAGFGTGSAILCILRQMLHYLAGEYHESLRAARSASPVLGAVSANPLEVHHHVFQALAAAALHAGATGDERGQYHAMIEQAEQRLAVLAESCPENFADRHTLLEGELARTGGDLAGALRAYERSARLAREQGFIHMEALAHLVAGRVCAEHGLDTAALASLSEAHRCFTAWGAHGMARELERSYPRLAAQERPDSQTSTSSAGSVDLDVQTIIKATRAISSEIQMASLSERLLAIATESAGADHGYLVLELDNERRVVDMKARSRPMAEVSDIAAAAVDQAMRSGQMVLVHDAVRDPLYGSDPHIARCGVKSLLCVPIELKGAVTGALYLENRLVAGSFTAERMSVLEVVATQAAISLENAALYQDMEQRVVERTQELEETQQKLMITAHQAGMAEIASSVLHNVGNILNSLNVSANVIYDELRNLRLPLLERAVALIEENSHDLARFLTEDAKGTRLPALLRGVCDHLLDREKELSAELKRLEHHVHHLDAIVHMQQRYADPSRRLLELCSMRDLVEDALSFKAVGLEKHNITVKKQYHDSQACYIEKHRVLQILVNLIANAKHAMISTPKDRPRVLGVAVEQDDSHTTVTITDTGKGILASDLPELFKFGFTTRPDGHGLGLHSCAINTQAISGHIEAHSDGPGRGARFTLTLPTRAPASPHSPGSWP